MKENILQNQSSKEEMRSIIKLILILFFVGGGGMTLVFGQFMGVHDLKSFIQVGSFQGFMWVILWMGNGSISDYLNSKFSWLEQPELRFILGVILTVGYTLGSLFLFVMAWGLLVFRITLERSIEIVDLGFFITAMLITAFIAMFLHGREFLKEWRASASEAARLKSENLSARYETLKNQVNPHFLFNSFNVLSTLVYKDQDLAAKFIKKMSNLYRYVLETKDKETVSVEDELQALFAFTFLSKMRFGDNLHFNIELDAVKGDQIAPMTLQMLVENAIKHNVVSKAKPLNVEVLHEEDHIIVQNNLQRKNNVTASAGIGLPNIQARYEYLSEKKVTVEETDDRFVVKIPLLKL